MVLTEQKDTSFYPDASLETATIANERLYYSSVDTGRVNKSTVSGYPTDTYTNPNDYIQKLNGNGPRVGMGIVLKVMAGDKFNLRVNSWWNSNNTPGTPVNPLNDLLSALNGGVSAVSSGHYSPTDLSSNSALNPGATNFLNSHTGYSGSIPKAFINWVLFDEQFKFVSSSSGFEQVGSSNIFATHTRTNVAINKSGYLYVYVSNETPNIDVFFDNLQVTHIRGALISDEAFFPFGLVQAGISSRALNFGNPENKRKFNDGTELENKEFTDGSGLEMYATTYRSLDPQIGRFWQIDPLAEISHTFSQYSYANNNPIFLNDPTGLLSDSLHPVVLPEVIIKSKIPKPLDTENGQVYPAQSWLASAFSEPRTFTRHFPIKTEKGTVWLPIDYEVDSKGYLTTHLARIYLIAPSVGFTNPLNLRAIFRLKNFIKGEYSIYRGLKNGLDYFGKAKGGLLARYTADEIRTMEATVIQGLEKLPNNAVALGVEQLVIDLNGGAGTGVLANINNATVKEIYINEARYWLDSNMPNWEKLLKFK